MGNRLNEDWASGEACWQHRRQTLVRPNVSCQAKIPKCGGRTNTGFP
jgi:hypothetical protein